MSTTQEKTIKLQKEKERNKEEIQNHLENKVQNGNKYIFINNYFKCQWTKCSDQNAWSDRLDDKTRKYNMLPKTRIYNMLPISDPLQGKGHTQIESEWMEKDISCKQKLQESGGSNTHIR